MLLWSWHGLGQAGACICRARLLFAVQLNGGGRMGIPCLCTLSVLSRQG
jgi:hypothetical protein